MNKGLQFSSRIPAFATAILIFLLFQVNANAQNPASNGNCETTVLSDLNQRLASFSTSEKNNQLISSWTISHEQQVDGYELQGSSDGENFKRIRFVTANRTGKYIVVNRRPSNHCNYYRLKVINADGVYAYSKVITLNDNGDVAVTAYASSTAKN